MNEDNQKRRILVVDDDPNMIKLIQKVKMHLKF